MKFNMANFFPMLSSSPPPIDDADSPENEDDDEFGIFTSANSAFDCSFDNDIFDKGSTTGSDSSKAKVVEKDASTTSGITSVKETTAKNHPQSFCKKDLPEDIENAEYKNTDLKQDTVFVNSCKPEIHVNSQCADTPEHCEPLEDTLENNRQKHPVKSDVPVSDSSQASLCNNGPINFHPITGDLEYADDDEEIPIKTEPTGVDRLDDVNILPSAEVLSESDSVHMSSEKTVECENEGRTCDDDDLEDPAVVPNDFSQYSSSFDYSLPHADNPSECNDAASSGMLSSDDAKVDNHNGASNSSDIPDLTFIPFSPEENNDDVEEFDEFLDSDFSYAVEQQENQCSNGIEDGHSNKSISPVESEDDEFGDFETGKPVIQTEVQNLETEEEENGFADFESSEIHSSECAVDFSSVPQTESEEFADFEAANLELPTATPKEPDKEKKLSTVINAVFPVSEESATGSSNNESMHDVLEQNCKSRRLWERLHDTDETPGLPFQWSVSHSFQQMLRSINVDYHSILRTSTVPFFASGLGLLEPTKGTATAAESKKTDTDAPNIKEPIPPVHFDWGSSGLVNPLDCGQSIATIMDLSFLNSSTTTSTTASSGETGRDFSLENELLMTSLEPNPSDTCPRAPILEHLLSLGAKSSLAESHPCSRRPPSLSQEAVHVLDQLPDISFMKAQVLMFPISNST